MSIIEAAIYGKIQKLSGDLKPFTQKGIDLITAESLEQPSNKMSDKLFRDIVNQERREIYAVA